jgi:hypothetical protein
VTFGLHVTREKKLRFGDCFNNKLLMTHAFRWLTWSK